MLTPDERRAERAKLLKYAGSFNSGDPRSADNDRIDADLASLMAFAGTVPFGDVPSSDNDKIDADLTRTYAASHAPEK